MASDAEACKPKNSSLSVRGLRYINFKTPLMECYIRYQQNKYDKDKNPGGIINLGTSENKLITDIIVPKLNELLKVEDEHCHYYPLEGVPRFRKTLAEFLERYMKPAESISPNHVVAFNGCGSAVKCLGSVICDPGDGVLIPTPYYGGFDLDLFLESEIKRFPVNLYSKPHPETNAPFELTVNDLEESLLKAKEQEVPIRALLLCNPTNPLGTIYSEKTIRECMAFAEKHSLHLISDEIYMLSIFKEGCSMKSALAISGIINPERLHIVWGFSKDFGMSGIRAGLVCSRNMDVVQALLALTYFHSIPAVLQEALGSFISDHEWLDNTLIPTSHKRLRECHRIVSEALQRIGVPVVESCSALYVWVDLRSFIHPLDFKTEKSLSDNFLDHAVYINPGYAFNCAEPGWFRIVIASDPPTLKSGMERIVKLLENLKLKYVEQGVRNTALK